MKLKKILSLGLVLAFMAGTISACNNNSNSQGNTSTPDENTPAVNADSGDKAPGTEDNEGADSNATNVSDNSGDTLSVHVGSEPDTIDPALNSAADVATVILHAFEGLMNLDENGTPVYGAAESFTVSDDGLVYTFILRDNLVWSDGQPITAGDFVYSWNRAVSPDTAADYEYMFDVISGYEEGELDVVAIDDKTLQVTLYAATPYFDELCAFPTFFPVREDLIEQYGDEWSLKPETYIGNGPYKLTEWAHNSYLLFTKNENYWNADAIGPDNIKFILMDDDNAILAAYRQGEILFADSMPNDEIAAWKDNPEFYLNGQLGTYYVSFNTERIDDPLIRKALILAIDRDWICVNVGQSGQQPAGAFVSIGLTDSDPTKEFREIGGDYYDPYDYETNLELAREALEQAGYPNGEGLPVYEYIYNEGTGHQAIGEALQDMWSKIGIRLELVSQDWATFLNTRKDGEYDIARNGWLCDYNDPISMLDMWVTGGGNNDAQWSNTQYDSLISQIKASSDKAERMQLMHDAEDIMFDEWMLCPLYYYVDLYLMSPQLEGAYASPLGYKYFMYSSF